MWVPMRVRSVLPRITKIEDRTSFVTVTYQCPPSPALGMLGRAPSYRHFPRSARAPSTEGMIGREVHPLPQRLRRPRLGRRCPEGVRGRKTERQEPHGAQVRAPRRDVALADLRLVAGDPHREPAGRVEGA